MARLSISVISHTDFDGRVSPWKLMLPDGTRIKVDKILDVRQGSSLKAGVQGIRYICRCTVIADEFQPSKEEHLFRDGDRWFMEADDPLSID